ncbi:LacI family DNA-binding transcriptional regulator [Microbacterium sp. Marseille-Q6648]|uniref:LacI family DNA-binding transcriptional regulator n=1 Tax=Microbacterium sp. Marseille-Q6648 TaxID=2937991 RepID=UPI002041C5B3|nr:LacI family DNA-binding transcriptional regulator [Microbacterium sp. Marseille-Q6648]
MATIRDVAREAGVSAMTVSNVLNGHAHVRPATREKVLAAMAALDYRVSPAARRLRSGRTGTIGLAVPDISQPYFGVLAGEVIEAAAARGLHVAIEQTNASREQELEAVALARRLMIDGLILSALAVSTDDLRALDYPLVFIGEKTLDDDLSQVAMPNVEGARAAVAHLIATGSRAIAVIGGQTPDEGIGSSRLAGYEQAHADAGLTPEPGLRAVTGYTSADGAAAIERMLARGIRFDAVFCMTDSIALGALHALVSAGVRVPQDVEVMGFDDLPLSRFANPSLSSVSPDHHFMAEAAVDQLQALIDHRDTPSRRVTAPFTLTLRGSTR